MADPAPIALAPRDAALARLGLRPDLLMPALRAILDAHLSVDPYAVSASRGFASWDQGVTMLRHTLLPEGWRIDRTRGVESVVHPSEAFRVVTMRGDQLTGLLDAQRQPRTYREYGPETMAFVVGNRRQREIFDERTMRTSILRGAEPEFMDTWVLLFHVGTDQLRAELSLPIACDAASRVITQWKPRIVLDPVPFHEDAVTQPTPNGASDPPETQAIDIPVIRRG